MRIEFWQSTYALRAVLPNLSFNRTCFGVASPGVISFSPGFATLAHAG